jgi:hypothetical protein
VALGTAQRAKRQVFGSFQIIALLHDCEPARDRLLGSASSASEASASRCASFGANWAESAACALRQTGLADFSRTAPASVSQTIQRRWVGLDDGDLDQAFAGERLRIPHQRRLRRYRRRPRPQLAVLPMNEF